MSLSFGSVPVGFLHVSRCCHLLAGLGQKRDSLPLEPSRGRSHRNSVSESTGMYWKPVWNVLEGQFNLLLVNAQHVKNVPGRKTDVKDSEWIAELLQYGLLRPSFVPETRIRDLRD